VSTKVGKQTSGIHLTSAFDQEIAELVQSEEQRQLETINLIPSENFASPISTELEGCIFACKNAEGYPGRRFVAGCDYADKVEKLAIARLKKIFNCEHANVQGMSATIANVALLQAVLDPGDVILTMGLSEGGHLSHGANFHVSGRQYKVFHYGVKKDTETINYEEVAELAISHKPKLIVCGASSYPRNIDFMKFGDIARSVGALLWADIAHTVGLIVAGVIPSPFPYADFVTSSTHKTWRGPRGGAVVLCRKEWARKVDRALFPGLQGAPKMDLIAARAVFFKEVQTEEFRAYAKDVIKNASALAKGLKQSGTRLVSGGTDTHLVLIDVRSSIGTGAAAQDLLESVGIITNRNQIPFDRAPPEVGSGLRLGSPAMTTRGMMEEDFFRLGQLISCALSNHDSQLELSKIKAETLSMTNNLPLFAEKWLPRELFATHKET